LSTYALVTAKVDGALGRTLRQSDIDCEAITTGTGDTSSATGTQSNEQAQCNLKYGFGPSGNTMIVRGVTMAKFAEYLQPHVQRMITDRTGLKGAFDVELDFYMDPATIGLPPPAGPPIPRDSPSLFEALEQQLGLKLQSQRGPVEVLVIDSAERPSEN
jgi:uncharacterized protein (TIGR03435 family)